MILVLGATGFLGKRVCKKLNDYNYQYNKSSLSLGIDLREKDQIEYLFDKIKPNYVINCAAYVGGIQFGRKHAAEIFYNNMQIINNIYFACNKFSVNRLINPIANCSYPAKAMYFNEKDYWNGPLHESVMVYGNVRKMLCIGSYAYGQQYGLDSINLILSNMYGPGDYFEEERSHALGALIMKIMKAKIENIPFVKVWGSGKPVREWLYVDDGAEALIKSLYIKPYSDIINIGIGKGISVHDMAYKIKDIIDYNGELVFDSSMEDGALFKTVDGSRGKELLGWQPETNFEQGLHKTIEWYKNYLQKANEINVV